VPAISGEANKGVLSQRRPDRYPDGLFVANLSGGSLSSDVLSGFFLGSAWGAVSDGIPFTKSEEYDAGIGG